MHDWQRYVREQLGDLGLRPEQQAEIVEELAQHLESLYSEGISRGLPSGEALDEAKRDIGDWSALRQAARNAKGGSVAERLLFSEPPKVSNQRLQLFLDGLWHDIRFVARSLFKSPGYAAVTIASLALGIGSNTAIFTILNKAIFQPLPPPDAERIVMICEQNPTEKDWCGVLMTGKMFAMKEHATSFEEIGLAGWPQLEHVAGEDFAERMLHQTVDIQAFSIFGAQPQLGRLFEPDDIVPGGRSVAVVISDGLWTRRFGRSSDVIGKSLEVKGERKVVIGVMRPGFWLNDGAKTDIWRATDLTGAPQVRGSGKFARLRQGVSAEQARTEAETISLEWDRQFGISVEDRWPTNVIPLREVTFGRVTDSLWMLQVAVGLVLLIACVNVANMMMARGMTRRRELGIRAALGASRARVARLLFIESTALGLLGGVAGVLFAAAGIRLCFALAPPDYFLLQDMRIDGNVLVFMVSVSLLTGLLFGLPPVVRLIRHDLRSAMREGGRTSSHGMGRQARASLLVSQLALAATLLGCAGLLINGMMQELREDRGYQTDGIMTAGISIEGKRYWTQSPPDYVTRLKPAAPSYWTTLLQRIRAIPGVESAGIGSSLPTFSWDPYPLSIAGRPDLEEGGKSPRASSYSVDPGFFDVLRIPLLKGRYIDEQDVAGAPWTAVVDRRFVDLYFPNDEPIGQRVRITRFSPGANQGLQDPHEYEIVGVIDNVRDGYWVDVPVARIYHSYLQIPTEFTGEQFRPTTQMTLFLKGAFPAGFVAPLREIVADLDSTQVVWGIETLDAGLEKLLWDNRFYGFELAAFAALAVILAAVGIYGVISFTVNQRRGEFGIRMALGARRISVLGLVLKDAVTAATVGLLIGFAATFGFRTVLDSMFHGLTAVSPLALVTIGLVLSTTAILAALGPARRAANTDPARVLRAE